MPIFILFIVIAGAITLFAYMSGSKANTAWDDAARALDLTRSPGSAFSSGQIAGTIDGVRIDVNTETRGSGDNRKTFTVYSAILPVAGPNVDIRREGNARFFHKLFGGEDLTVGDALFDDAVRVDGANPANVRDYLSPARRIAILSLFELFPKARLTGGHLKFESRGREADAARLESNVRRLANMALIISQPQAVDDALQLEAQGDLAEGADALAAANRDQPNVFTQLLEAEARVALGERQKAATILREVEQTLPNDPEVAGWRRVAEQPLEQLPVPAPPPTRAEPPVVEHAPLPDPVVAPTPAQPPEPVVAPTPVSPVDLSVGAVIADLFVSNRMSYAVEEHFAAAYRGRTVRWSGTITKLNETHLDRDFGDTPGRKAVVLVGHLGDGQLVSDEIDAIVQLPIDAEVSRDDFIEFTGTLLRVDRFMRNIYIADASLA